MLYVDAGELAEFYEETNRLNTDYGSGRQTPNPSWGVYAWPRKCHNNLDNTTFACFRSLAYFDRSQTLVCIMIGRVTRCLC